MKSREGCRTKWLAVVDCGGIEYAVDLDRREFRQLCGRDRAIRLAVGQGDTGRQMAVARGAKLVGGEARSVEDLIAFCMDNWDNEFALELQDELCLQGTMLGYD